MANVNSDRGSRLYNCVLRARRFQVQLDEQMWWVMRESDSLKCISHHWPVPQ
jgi:hypothetical protein